MNKKVYVILLTLLLVISFASTSLASETGQSNAPIQPRWSILDTAYQNFEVSSGTAIIEALTIANNNATSASVVVNLQRKSGTNSWTTIKSWTVSQKGNRASFATTWLVLTGYYYRLETIHSASYGGQTETTVLVSGEKYAM